MLKYDIFCKPEEKECEFSWEWSCLVTFQPFSVYNIMDLYNAEYRPYHLIYTHPNSNVIYLGDLTAASNLNFIHSQNIATVVTAALGMDQLDYSQMNVKHIIYPLLDSKRQNVTDFFNNFYEIVERQIRGGNVLVHCSTGVSRAPTLVISYLMKKQNWTFREAIEYVRAKGRKVMPNIGFERQLKTYETMLRKNGIAIHERKAFVMSEQSKKKYNRMKFIQTQLPNLHTLQTNAFNLTNSLSSVGLFGTMTPRKQTSHTLRRPKLNTSQARFSSKNYDHISPIRVKRNSFMQSQSQQINNFQVRKVSISQRTPYHKRIRSKVIIHSP